MWKRTTHWGTAIAVIALVGCTSVTETDLAIGTPELLMSSGVEVAPGSRTVLAWTAVDAASTYAMEIRRVDSQGTSVEVRFFDEEEATLIFRSTGFHRIRLRALDAAGRAGPWSEFLDLRVVSAGDRFVD